PPAPTATYTLSLHDALPISVGRKFLIAGKGGLNLTHAEPRPVFDQRYRERSADVAGWLDDFDGDALREWSRGLGAETYVGSSDRVFPMDREAAPLLRGWVRRLREQGVRFHVHHRWIGWDAREARGSTPRGARRVDRPAGLVQVKAPATVRALGGASWSQLGSDGARARLLSRRDVDVAPLQTSHSGFDIDRR